MLLVETAPGFPLPPRYRRVLDDALMRPDMQQVVRMSLDACEHTILALLFANLGDATTLEVRTLAPAELIASDSLPASAREWAATHDGKLRCVATWGDSFCVFRLWAGAMARGGDA